MQTQTLFSYLRNILSYSALHTALDSPSRNVDCVTSLRSMCQFYAHVYTCKHTTYALGKYCHEANLIQKPCAKRSIWQALHMGEDCDECAIPSWRIPSTSIDAGEAGEGIRDGEQGFEGAFVSEKKQGSGKANGVSSSKSGDGKWKSKVPASRTVTKGRKSRKK